MFSRSKRKPKDPYLGQKDVISHEILSYAIMNALKKKNTENPEESVAGEMADHVLNFFGYGERIIDNVLETKDRDIFYTLEDLGLLKQGREEITLYDGREWRIFYWTLKKNYIETLINEGNPHEEGVPEPLPPEEVYTELSDEAWNRGDYASGAG